MKTQLVDTKPIRLAIVEGDDDGKVRVRGEFARAGKATENKRVYPQKIWESEIGRLQDAMKSRRVYGEADHPGDGRTSLNRISHIVTDMRLENGVLIGEAEILPTDKGKNLMALLKAGCQVGVSSRGYGSTKSNEKGEEVVQEDYRLVTFDFVADPADQTAYPEVFFEGVEFGISGSLTPAQEKQKSKDWAARILAAAEAEENGGAPEVSEKDKTKLGAEMLAALAALKDDVRAELRSEMLGDPDLAGARTALEQIMSILRPFVLPEDAESVVKSKEAEIAKLKKDVIERDLQIQNLTTENTKLGDAAKEAGYKLYIERQLLGDPDAGLVKKMLGDVKLFENADALKTRLSGVRTELTNKRTEAAKIEEAKSRDVQRARDLARKTVSHLEDKVDTLTEVVEKLSSANKAITLRLYAEKKLRNHPRSAKIRKLIEAADPQTQDDIDQVIESYTAPAPKDDDDAEGVRSRIRRLSRGGYESSALEEETPPKKKTEEDYNGLGIDLGELQRLSGNRTKQQ